MTESDNQILKEIGQKIKDRRNALKINQQTLADLSDVSLNTVVAIERGSGNPSLGTLLRIINTLGLKVQII